MNRRKMLIVIALVLLVQIHPSVVLADTDPVITTMYVSKEVTSFLFGRSEPDKKSSKEARFFPGDAIDVVEIKEEWVRAIGGECKYVWVSREYVTAQDPCKEPIEYVVEGNGRVNVRNIPDGDHVRWASIGEIVTVYGWVGKWAEVDGGYIDADFLVEADANE
ncbi:MAG: hypothetical protein RSC06_00930 [Clostridia bacterium]